MDINGTYRHELKYRCSDAQIAIMKSRLQPLMQTDSHSINGGYLIRSMYFDDFSNRCYFENENGVDPREKYRIRIYNASDSFISLECKRKEREKTYKSACQITKEQFMQILNGGRLQDLEQESALLRKFNLLLRTEFFRPAVIVEYERTPYVYAVGNVRVTLDRNIRSSDEFAGFFNGRIKVRPILPQGQHLLEVKYDGLLPDFIKAALQMGNLQQTAFSKYYLCRKYNIGG